jgi:pimeloyl-ACP methyl ester carboxylesterase
MFPAGRSDIRTRTALLPSGVALRVAESGPGDGVPVLLLHGWGASVYMWRDWFAPLAAAGFRVIAVDLPGHGLSDKPEDHDAYRLPGMTRVLREFLAAEGLDGVDVVAQSMAGTIALELAREHRTLFRRMALVNPACFGLVRTRQVVRVVSPLVSDRVLPKVVARWLVDRTHRMVYADASRITQRDVDEYWAPSQFPSYARAMRRLLHEFDWRRPRASEMAQRLAALPSPPLVILGRKDHLVRDAGAYVRALQAANAPLRMAEIANGGHAVNEERPQEVLAEVLPYLRQR